MQDYGARDSRRSSWDRFGPRNLQIKGCVKVDVMQKILLDIISQHVAHVEFVVAFAITSLEALPKDYIHATV